MNNGFRGDLYFLSNMYPCNIEYDGYTYNNVEAAFQAQKNDSAMYKYKLTCLDGREAKKEGRKIKLKPEWEKIKDHIMLDIVRAKFNQHPGLMKKLITTPTALLIEYNTWHDNYWGHCICPKCKNKLKRNVLGNILSIIKKEQK